MDEGFRELPAVRVADEPAVRPGETALLDERTALTAPAEAVVLETHDHERREEVVEERDVDVRRGHARHVPELSRGPRRAVLLARRLEEAREPDVVSPRRHRAGEHVGGGLTAVARALGGDDEQGHRAVGLDAAIEEAEGIGHEAGGVVIGQRHRGAHDRTRVSHRVVPERDRHLAVVVVGRAVVDPVAHGDHRHLLEGGDEAVRHVPLVQPRELGLETLPVASPEVARAAVHRLLAARS